MSRAKNSAYDTKENSFTSGITSHPNTTPNSNNDEFVNHGYERWLQLREEWKSFNYQNSNNNNNVSNKQISPTNRRRPEPRSVDVEEILDRIFNSRDGNMTLPEPVPLGTMIDILLDVWEADGLYD